MSLIPSKQILAEAQKAKYAVGAFNINNMEILQAVVEAASEKHSPALIQVTESAAKYAGLNYLMAMVRVAASGTDIPFSLHLDHGKNPDMIKKCIEIGFTSVMIDGSHLPFEENIAVTKKIVDLAHTRDISVEAELGKLAGIEDNVSVDEKEAILTDPEEAKIFVEKTGVDALAVAVGTSHGAYKFKAEVKLALDRIKTIKELTGIPLVLHGASSVPAEIIEEALKYGARLPGAKGVPAQSIKEAIANGISKINIDTDLRLAFTVAVRKVLVNEPEVFDPRKIIGPARNAIKDVVKTKMDLFGSSGRA